MRPMGRLHVITDTVLQSRFSHLDLARLAIAGGADTLQFRQKDGATRAMIDIAMQMKRLCADKDVTFIVNDRLDIAIASEADGVHLGQDDFPIPQARKLLGDDKIIGGSAVNLEEAEKCLSEGANYVGFGPVYPTDSKADAGPVTGVDLLRQAVEAIPLPIIAIGGISAENTPELMETGAHGIAVISAVCCHEDPERATRALYGAVQASREGKQHA